MGAFLEIAKAYFLDRRNAPITGCMILLFMMATWNVRQENGHFMERMRTNEIMYRKDSIARAEREQFIGRIIELRRDVTDCKAAMHRIETENEKIKSELKRLKR